jgi:hypothetical protein
MQFADSEGNIAAGALIQTNVTFFVLCFSVFREILKGKKIVSCDRLLCLHFLKGLPPRFYFISKKYHISFCKRGFATACNMKNP